MRLLQKLTDGSIDPFFAEWNILREQALTFHQMRNGLSEEPTLKGTEILRQLLVYCHGEVVPLNAEERIAFIESQPATYAAFRQLDELFNEMRKMVAAKRIQLKRTEM